MNLNLGQILALIIATLGVLTAGGSQLDVLFGAAATKAIVAAGTLTMSTLSAWMAILFGQGYQVAAVRSMPGVEKITVNAQANQTLAAMAVDPTETKIEPTPQAEKAVQATAASAES